MQKLKLIQVTKEHKEIILAYKEAFTLSGDSIDGSAGLQNYDTYDEWFKDLTLNATQETLNEGCVQSTTYLGMTEEKNELIGMISIRHELNDYLKKLGGHIGYSVTSSQRKKGYATTMLKLALEECKRLRIENVLITCDKENVASAKTIKNCGGQLENEVKEDQRITQRYWIKTVKELKDLSLDELWILFPIILKDYNPDYPTWYESEKSAIEKALGSKIIKRINHFGSTAVKGLLSKSTIDILLEIDETAELNVVKESLINDGWLLMHQEDIPNLHYVFNKGYSKFGYDEKVYHLHLRHPSDWHELYFRDYLNDHPEIAVAYGNLKKELMAEYKNNRDGYTDAKTNFIKKYTEKAKDAYPNRYKFND